MKEFLTILLTFVIIPVIAVGCAEVPKTANTSHPYATPVFAEHDQGITLYECLDYGDSCWLEIEDRFVRNVLENMPYEYGIYDASELSEEILSNRKGMVVVERCIGFVTNKTTGDGKVLNAYDKDYDYISYRSVDDQNYCDGTVFISYMVYNPDNNYVDDIVERYDFVLCHEWED